MKRTRILLSSVLGGAVLLGSGVAVSRCAAQSAPVAPPLTEADTATARALGNAYAAVAAHVRPAVVSVYSEKTAKYQSPGFPFEDDLLQQFFGSMQPRQAPHAVPQRGMGSGMILDGEGHILTNCHVVKDVDEIKVQLADKRQFEATIVGTDPKTDVAVIQIKGSVPSHLPAVVLGDSGSMRVGELVMAIGAPFGLTQTVTTGILSAKGRSDVGITDYEDFLQTDAPINPGNSGGPLVNMRGEVIGMNSAIATNAGQSAGVGFSIPANMIKTLLPALLKGKAVSRGQLGVVIQEITPALAKQLHVSKDAKGALVAEVNGGSAAEKAGIQTGDVIVKLDGREISDTRALRNAVAALQPGATARVQILRDGKESNLTVRLDEQKGERLSAQADQGQAAGHPAKLGVSLEALTPDLARQYDLSVAKGVVIVGIEGGSPAAQAGLQEGDLILEVAHHRVDSPESVVDVLAKADTKEGVLLRIRRKGNSLFVVVQPR